MLNWVSFIWVHLVQLSCVNLIESFWNNPLLGFCLYRIFFSFLLSVLSFFTLTLWKHSTFFALFTISMLLWGWKFQVKLTSKSSNFLTMPSVASFGVFKKEFLIIEQYPKANNAPRALRDLWHTKLLEVFCLRPIQSITGEKNIFPI